MSVYRQLGWTSEWLPQPTLRLYIGHGICPTRSNMNRFLSARAFIVFALLALAAPTPSARNAAADNFAASVSVAASCRVSRQPSDGSTATDAADLVALQCASGSTGADPQTSVSPPSEADQGPDDTAHRVVTIHF
jgi:hypothetical protein